MRIFLKEIVILIVIFVGFCSNSQEVSRNLTDLDAFIWEQEWSTAKGYFKRVKDIPKGDNIDKNYSILLNVAFDGKGFKYYNIALKDKKIPGKVKSISLWGKKDGDTIPCIISFKVQNQKKGKKYEWIPKLTNQWKEYKFNIPSTWPPVVSLGITSHNWLAKNKKQLGSILVNNLLITSDITSVKDKSSLLSISTTTGRPRNIFLYNEKIKYNVTLGCWNSEVIEGNIDIIIKDVEGGEVYKKNESITLASSLSKELTFKPTKYGVYNVEILVELEGYPLFKKSSRCVCIPEIAKSTEKEKRISPWGINIHGGMEGVAYSSIAKLGFCWIRDYAYNIEWLKRGEGEGDWDGWPWYKKMDSKIKKAGLKLIPSMMKGIERSIIKYPTPPRDWKNIYLKFMMRFPDYDAYEPDNELDLHIPKELAEDKYQSYGRYHKKFAEIIKFMNPNSWVSTQGTAGFKSHIVEQMVKEGYFNDIDIINGHFYTGIYPPLMSQRNENTGQGSEEPKHFYDRLREFVAAADVDGKNRQSWITEFGWDTLAVKIVTEKEQAAYAQRGYTIALIGGVDKMFWYWNRDTKKSPDTYFDGMGIFDPKDEPKPVVGAIAAMIHLLKEPKPIGSFDMGLNSFGHIFEDRGRLVALAFKIDKDKVGPEVLFKTGKLYDMYGNPLKGRKHRLDIDPIWIDGITKDDPLVKESVYDLKSKWLVLCAAGDECEIKIEVNNNREENINSDLKIKIPKGWSITKNCPKISVLSGEKKVFTLKARIDPTAEAGEGVIDVKVSEGEIEKNMRTRVKVVAPVTLSTIALSGAPGICDLKFSIINNSLSSRTFVLKPKLPKGWNAVPKSLKIIDLSPKKKKDILFKIKWNNEYSENDKAEIKVFNEEGREILSKGIIPNSRILPLVKDIKFDGDFNDWPLTAKIPNWAIGKIGIPKDVEIYVAYSPEGLYVGAKIEPSTINHSNPKIFWSMDCMEVCIDTKNNKIKRNIYNSTDHQFWIIPMIEDHKVYVGRWKRNDEIPKTEYNIPNIKSFSKKTKNGYVMEFLIPANKIIGFKAEKGNKIAFSINLTAPGRTETITCYWPLPKTEGVITKPYLWGRAEMK